jgi:hypothetical protein
LNALGVAYRENLRGYDGIRQALQSVWLILSTPDAAMHPDLSADFARVAASCDQVFACLKHEALDALLTQVMAHPDTLRCFVGSLAQRWQKQQRRTMIGALVALAKACATDADSAQHAADLVRHLGDGAFALDCAQHPGMPVTIVHAALQALFQPDVPTDVRRLRQLAQQLVVDAVASSAVPAPCGASWESARGGYASAACVSGARKNVDVREHASWLSHEEVARHRLACVEVILTACLLADERPEDTHENNLFLWRLLHTANHGPGGAAVSRLIADINERRGLKAHRLVLPGTYEVDGVTGHDPQALGVSALTGRVTYSTEALSELVKTLGVPTVAGLCFDQRVSALEVGVEGGVSVPAFALLPQMAPKSFTDLSYFVVAQHAPKGLETAAVCAAVREAVFGPQPGLLFRDWAKTQRLKRLRSLVWEAENPEARIFACFAAASLLSGEQDESEFGSSLAGLLQAVREADSQHVLVRRATLPVLPGDTELAILWDRWRLALGCVSDEESRTQGMNEGLSASHRALFIEQCPVNAVWLLELACSVSDDAPEVGVAVVRRFLVAEDMNGLFGVSEHARSQAVREAAARAEAVLMQVDPL